MTNFPNESIYGFPPMDLTTSFPSQELIEAEASAVAENANKLFAFHDDLYSNPAPVPLAERLTKLNDPEKGLHYLFPHYQANINISGDEYPHRDPAPIRHLFSEAIVIQVIGEQIRLKEKKDAQALFSTSPILP